MNSQNVCFLWRNKKIYGRIIIKYSLILKMPRKHASENVVCLFRLLNFLQTFQIYFCIQANSVDPDQTAAKGAV